MTDSLWHDDPVTRTSEGTILGPEAAARARALDDLKLLLTLNTDTAAGSEQVQ